MQFWPLQNLHFTWGRQTTKITSYNVISGKQNHNNEKLKGTYDGEMLFHIW